MSGPERRDQVLAIAAVEFADHGLYGASTESIARTADITQAYVFRLFGTKKALFLELVGAAFDRFVEGMATAAGAATGLDALTRMGGAYYAMLDDRTTLLLQLQGFAACADADVRDLVRGRLARMWGTVADATALEPVTLKAFLAFGMLLNNVAALELDGVDEAWADGLRTRIEPGLFAHITTVTNA
jgi:AcrR family transcriptional regulator